MRADERRVKGLMMRKLMLLFTLLLVSLTLRMAQADEVAGDCIDVTEAMALLEQEQAVAVDDPAESLRLVGEARALLEGIEADCTTALLGGTRFESASLFEANIQPFSLVYPAGWRVQADEVRYSEDGSLPRGVALPLTNTPLDEGIIDPADLIAGQQITLLMIGELLPMLDLLNIDEEVDDPSRIDSAATLGDYLLSSIADDETLPVGEVLPVSAALGTGVRFSIDLEIAIGWVVVWDVQPEVYGVMVGFALPGDFEALMSNVEFIAASVQAG
jgi:hypothetical protein